MPQQPDYYSILSLPPGTSIAEIKRQYRQLAKIYHPDRNPGAEEWCVEQLRKVNDAYQFLSDPASKERYDREMQGRKPADSGRSSAGPEWGTTGDGRSTYTRWRPNTEYRDEQAAPPPPPVTPAKVYRKRDMFALIAVTGTICIALAAGAYAYLSHQSGPEETAPVIRSLKKPATHVLTGRSAAHPPHRHVIVTGRNSTQAQPVRHAVHRNAPGATPQTTSASQKDRNAERLFDAVVAAKKASGTQ